MKRIFTLMMIFVFVSFAIPISLLSASAAAQNTGRQFFAYNKFNNGANMKVVDTKGGSIEHIVKDGDGMMHYVAADGTESDSYTDMTVNTLGSTDEYVIEAEITPVAVEGSSYIGMFDSKVESSWRRGVDFTSDGKIKAYDSEEADKVEVGTWQSGVPVVMSLCYNASQGKYDVYLDGVLAKADINCIMGYSSTFRIDMVSAEEGRLEFYIDDIRIYTGTAPLTEYDPLVAFSSNSFES